MNVLNRGYSITMADGKVLKTVGEAKEGTVLKTILADGTIASTTISVIKSETDE